MNKPQVVIPRFEVLRGGKVLQTLPINRNRIVVGSEDGAHLRLKHPAIAPRHLEVTVVNGRYLEAANLAGEGRVLLGGQPMNRARLRSGDELDLGPVTLRLSYHKTDQSSESPVIVGDSGEFRAARTDEEDEETVEGAAPTDPTTTHGDVNRPLPPEVGGSTVDSESDTSSRLSTLGELLVPAGTTTSERLPTLPSLDSTDSRKLAVDLDESVLDPAPLVIIEPPGGKAQEIPLRVGSFVVGAGRCAFRLSYPGVAPAHTEIMVMPDGIVYVKHLAGSGLLTLRNGAPIQFARWASGDRLQVGPVAMRLELVSRDLVIRSSQVSQVTSAHSGIRGSGEESTTPSTVPDIVQAAEEALSLEDVSSTTTFSGRSLPRSITQEGPAPLSEPLVKVNKAARKPTSGRKKAKKTRKRTASAPRSNSVVVSLDVTSYETFQSFDDDLDYRPSVSRRFFLPALVLLLVAALGIQYLYVQSKTTVDGSGPPSTPQTANGSSGLGDAGQGAATVGGAPVQVGDVGNTSRRSTGRSGRSSSAGSGLNIDWDDTRGMHYEGPRRSSYTGAGGRDFVARPADDIKREEPMAVPSEVAGEQGFVDMKLVNQTVTANTSQRKYRYCYEQGLQRDDRLEGTMWLNMTLGMDGRIRGVVMESRSTLKSETMRKCMAKKLFALPMPKPSGAPVTFSAPFKFAPSGP